MSRVTARARTLAGQPWYLAALAVVFATLAVVAARPAGAESGSLLVSPNADRSGATALDGATVSGTAYVFLSTSDDVQRVVFSLDGADVQVESYSPYDFAGSENPLAKPWSSSSAGDGPHTISALVSLVGGGDFTVSASFTVDNATAPPPPAPADGALLVSQSSDRGGATALEGATLSGDVYAFLQTGASVSRVEFSLDGAQQWTENTAPYDFAGTSGGAATAWSTTNVADGNHTISAVVVQPDASSFTVTASFTVANDDGDGTGDPSPTATPEPETASGELLVSSSASRGGASALGAAPLSGDAFVFLSSSAQLSEVRFNLDGSFVRTERLTPFDLGGTQQNGSAGRWDTTAVADGTHTIEATATTVSGTSFTVSASFSVDNDPQEGGDSEVETTSEDPPAGRTIAVFVSDDAGRGAAQNLGSDALTGEVYIFAVPSETPDRVRFYIDADQQPLPVRTEQVTPFDLGGTAPSGDARSFDIGSLDEGDHTLLAVAEFADGGTASSEVTFTVDHPDALPDTNYELLVSSSANRSGATALDGAQLEEASYVFVSPADHISEASFYLDNPAQSSVDRVDGSAPFDLVGGSQSTAQPLDIDDLAPGAHALTVVLTRTNGTTVDVSATFTVGGTVLPNGAILIETDDNAAQIASQHGPGTTFVFEAGTHRGVSIKPQNGDVFLGSPGAILSGTKLLSNWQSGGGYWYAGGQTSELTGSGGCGYYEDGSRYDACKYPEQVFVDGETWWQVTSIGQLSYGRWYFDYAANRVYLGANPSGKVVELSTVPYAFDGSASDVTISGLTIEKYANRAQTGAIHGGSSNRWTVSNNVLRLNHGFGLRVGNRMQVLNNYVAYNGQVGMGGIGTDVLVEGNEIAYNHTGLFLHDWEAGGTKFVLTNRLVFRDNWVHNNDGRGFWADIENVNMLVEDNLVEYNFKGGIVHEVGYSALIRNNVSRYNGHGFAPWVWGGQIVIQNSSDTVVTGNDVTVSGTAGGNGITIVNQQRGSGSQGLYRSDRVSVTDNTIRHLSASGRNGAPNGCNQDNTFDNNTYIAPASYFNYNVFEWCGVHDFEEFQDLGQEANGTAVIAN